MTGMYQIGDKSYPREMTDVPLWLIYRLVDKGNGSFSKPPVSPITGEVCSKTDEGKYTDFERALLGVEQHNADGVGFVFLHGFIAIDLDNCFEEDGSLNEMAMDIFDHFRATYIEYSPSGRGLHIFCQGEKPNDRTRSTGIEVYSGKNFVTVTGNHVPQSGEKVLNMQNALNWLFDKYLPTIEVTPNGVDGLVVDHGKRTPSEWLEIGLSNDEKLRKLYTDTDHADDESSHDMALMCKLAYWLNRDRDAMETVFFNSPWVHSKDRKHLAKVDKRSDYLELTMNKAIATVSSTAQETERKFKNIPDSRLRVSEDENGDISIPITDYTDVGNAKAFADMYSETLAYTKEWGWCYYNGFEWETCQEFQAQQCGIEFGESVMYIAKKVGEFYRDKCEAEGVNLNSKEGREIMTPAAALMKHAVRSNSESGIRAMLKLAAGMMLMPSSAFDSNAWELNTPNIVVDLRTGEIYPPAWNHYNTMMTNISYNPEAEGSGMWEDFLNTIFCGDEHLIDYMQILLGGSCVGKVYEENLTIATGCGSNGKSTLFGILKAVLGDYCSSVNPDILMGKVTQEQQIAAAELKGKRLVIAQETESGQVLSTAMVKRMVSTDNIIGRKLYQAPIEFTPSHSMMLATNHLPTVKDNDEGTWRRLTVVPFNAKITGDDIITNFQEVLIAEDGEYILKWLIEGAVRFYNNGCSYGDKPMAIRFASTQYRDAQQDGVDLFIRDCAQIVDPVKYANTWEYPDNVFRRYLAWCDENGVRVPLKKNQLSRELAQRGMVSDKKNVNGRTYRIWRNILLNDENGEPGIPIEM